MTPDQRPEDYSLLCLDGQLDRSGLGTVKYCGGAKPPDPLSRVSAAYQVTPNHGYKEYLAYGYGMCLK